MSDDFNKIQYGAGYKKIETFVEKKNTSKISREIKVLRIVADAECRYRRRVHLMV